ncbi:hypothetical protein ZOSMA_38G01270 [Zostera marina]|uniref:SAUR-like auxin-responsive protein family n=1 Tax=Zostera marina TaxID=29655 RepID=A0A0K9P4N6_ZOSMR|nr:hypothetical protein ZOSMA_38G01270 [Zostera marina]
MWHLIRRLSRVADLSTLPIHSSSSPSSSSFSPSSKNRRRKVPEGYVPVSVGEDLERFVVSADDLSRPAFVELLRRSAQEYGYEQRGVLRIPCTVEFFHRVLDAVSAGGGETLPEDIADDVSQY